MTNEFKREPKNLWTDQEREKWLDNKKKKQLGGTQLIMKVNQWLLRGL